MAVGKEKKIRWEKIGKENSHNEWAMIVTLPKLGFGAPPCFLSY